MLKQGYKHKFNFVILPYSADIVELLKINYKHGFISGFQLSSSAIKVFLKWSVEGSAGIQTIKLFAKPSTPHRLKFKAFVNAHIRSCAIAPIWLFKSKLGYTDHYALYKNKLGGSLVAILK